jgi:uncharacterized protein
MRSRRRPRAVVDTNLLISSVLSKLGLPYQLFLNFVDDLFTLLISNELRDELEEVLHRPHLEQFGLTAQARDDLLYLVDTKAIYVKPRSRLPVPVRDPKDNKVLAAALGGRADFLITGDGDLLALSADSRIGSLKIITVRAFLET